MSVLEEPKVSEKSPISPEQEEVLFQKERAMKCKLISLDELGHHPLTDPASFSKRDKGKVLDKMKEWFAKPDEEITEEFNEIVRDKLFDDKGGMDYTQFPIQDNNITYADHPEWKPAENMNHTIPQMDIGGNMIGADLNYLAGASEK